MYLHLIYDLDPGHWRVVKQLALATRLGMHENTVSQALTLLVKRGWIERQSSTPGAPRLYRLVYSRLP